MTQLTGSCENRSVSYATYFASYLKILLFYETKKIDAFLKQTYVWKKNRFRHSFENRITVGLDG